MCTQCHLETQSGSRSTAPTQVRAARCPAHPDRRDCPCASAAEAAAVHAGCKRKFASLWRLKVHYRAPPNERGSGKERGHGVELPICPACGEDLEPGKHHNKCKAGRTTNPPSKRAPKAGAGGKSGGRGASGAAKKRVKREVPNAVDTTSGNSFGDAAGTYVPAGMVPAGHEASNTASLASGSYAVRHALSAGFFVSL